MGESLDYTEEKILSIKLVKDNNGIAWYILKQIDGKYVTDRVPIEQPKADWDLFGVFG